MYWGVLTTSSKRGRSLPLSLPEWLSLEPPVPRELGWDGFLDNGEHKFHTHLVNSICEASPERLQNMKCSFSHFFWYTRHAVWRFSRVVTPSKKERVIEEVESWSLHQAKLELKFLNLSLNSFSHLKWDGINEFLLEYATLIILIKRKIHT